MRHRYATEGWQSSPRVRDTKERLRLLRKAVADAYGKDLRWMLEEGRAADLVRQARQMQELLSLQAAQRGITSAIREIESLCLLVEELLKKPNH